jgi:hypothetical protein
MKSWRIARIFAIATAFSCAFAMPSSGQSAPTIEQGNAALKAGKYNDALIIYDQLMKAAPAGSAEAFEASFMGAVTIALAGQYDAADSAFSNTTKMVPISLAEMGKTAPTALIMLLMSHDYLYGRNLKLHHWQQALENANALQVLEPQGPAELRVTTVVMPILLGAVHLQLGDEKGFQELDQAGRTNSEFAKAGADARAAFKSDATKKKYLKDQLATLEAAGQILQDGSLVGFKVFQNPDAATK